MYVVKRPFKSYGRTLAAGSIIEDPAAIRRFKTKLADGKIIEVTEANKQFYAEYFQQKFGVKIMQGSGASEGPQEPITPVVAEEPKHIAKTQSVKVVAAKVKK